MKKEYWISCEKFVGYVRTEGNFIVETSPIMEEFEGKTLLSLFNWIRKISKGLKVEEIQNEEISSKGKT